jgi:ketosteroid isomerase-like protein
MAGGCLPITPDDDQEALRAELAIRTLMAAWESADAAAIEELFWPEATYDDYPNQHTHQGAQEIVEYVMALHAWADDVYFNVGDVHVTRTGAVAEWIFSAVQARPMGADLTLATGLEVISNGVTIVELDRGRIRRAADYMDTRPIMLQLGGRIEMPGGGTDEGDGRR